MYDELIKRLRERSVFLFPHHGESRSYDADLMHEAADAIEELSAYVLQIDELRKDGYYLQKTKMATCGQAIVTMPLPEPPKEE